MSIMPFRAGRRVLSVFLVAALVGPGSALAEVVFGNLGGSGTSGLATTGSVIANNNRLAQGFSTGSSTARTLQSISLGMF